MIKDKSVLNSSKAPDVIDAFAVLNIMYTLFPNRFGIFVETQGRTSDAADETWGRLCWQMICLPGCLSTPTHHTDRRTMMPQWQEQDTMVFKRPLANKQTN